MMVDKSRLIACRIKKIAFLEKHCYKDPIIFNGYVDKEDATKIYDENFNPFESGVYRPLIYEGDENIR